MNRKLLSVTLFTVLVACLLLSLGHVAAQEEPAPAGFDWDYTYITETEPNDTPAQANAVVIDSHISGSAGWDGDTIDYFKFAGQAGDKIAVVENVPYRYQRTTDTLLRPNLNPVTLTPPARWAVLPANGNYTLGIASEYGGYAIYLVRLPANEPNETMATALPATIGQVITVVPDYPCDDDWFRFDGRAGDFFWYTTGDGYPNLWDADGNYTNQVMLPSDGVYYLEVPGYTYDDYYDDYYCDNDDWDLTLGASPWISAAADGLGGDPAIKEEDIVTRRTGGGWQLVFDASDVGIIQDVNAIDVLDDGSILMSLLAGQTVPGLGKVAPQDIIRFVPTSLGATTAGTFEWYLDGSDVGLTTTGEKIDAIDVQEGIYGGLRISLAGKGSVPRQSGGNLAVADEDLINFVAVRYGDNTAGKWRMNLKGSTVPGMAAEDINAYNKFVLWPASRTVDMLVMGSAFTIDGVSGGPDDLFDLKDGVWFSNFAGKPIDALGLGAAMP